MDKNQTNLVAVHNLQHTAFLTTKNRKQPNWNQNHDSMIEVNFL